MLVQVLDYEWGDPNSSLFSWKLMLSQPNLPDRIDGRKINLVLHLDVKHTLNKYTNYFSFVRNTLIYMKTPKYQDEINSASLNILQFSGTSLRIKT